MPPVNEPMMLITHTNKSVLRLTFGIASEDLATASLFQTATPQIKALKTIAKIQVVTITVD
jgi:hypothetical protein